MDLKIFLGSATEYVEFDVGNSQVELRARLTRGTFGVPVPYAVGDGPRSLVYEQAENRLHSQTAILERLMGAGDGLI